MAKPYSKRDSITLAVMAKALFLSFATMYPLYAVVDELTTPEHNQFKPCNDKPCRYMKIFGSEGIPGTGADVIQVQNGVSRPIFMHDYKLQTYTASYDGYKNKKAQKYAHKHYNDTHKAYVHSHHGHRDDSHGHQDDSPGHHDDSHRHHDDSHGHHDDSHGHHDDSHGHHNDSHGQHDENAHYEGHALQADHEAYLHEVIEQQQTNITKNWGYKWSFWIQKSLFRIFLGPFSKISHWSSPDNFGKHKIKPGVCPGLNVSQMKAVCDSEEIRARINIESLQGPARLMIRVGLIGWSIFKSIHDVLVVARAQEQYSILVGQVSALFQGISVFSIFFWSLGGFGVFGALVPNKVSDCMCYYQLPLLFLVGTLATPLVMLIYFFSKVQIVGRSILYGDYLYFTSYDVPAHLAFQSKTWTWSTLVGPWLAGTPEYPRGRVATLCNRSQRQVKCRSLTKQLDAEGEINYHKEIAAYERLTFIQYLLVVFRFVVWLAPVCMAAASIFFRGKELLIEELSECQSYGMAFAIRIALLMPVVFASTYPAYYVYLLLIEVIPEFLTVNRPRYSQYLSEETAFKILSSAAVLFEMTCSVAAAYGLWPGWKVIHGDVEWPNIAEAELVGASGFVLIALPLQQLFLQSFTCREDMLKYEYVCGRKGNRFRASYAPCSDESYNEVDGDERISIRKTQIDMDEDDYDGFGLKITDSSNTEFGEAQARE